MKRIVLVLTLLLPSLTGSAQISRITFSEDFKIAEGEYKKQIVAHAVQSGDFFYTVTNSGIGGNYKWAFTRLYDMKYVVTISKYDRNMNLIQKTELEKGDRVFGPKMPEIFLVNKKLFLGYYKIEDKSSFNFYLGRINEEDLSVTDSLKICTIEQKNVGLFKLVDVVDGSFITIANSPDGTKALVASMVSSTLLQTVIVDNNLHVLKRADLHTNLEDMEIQSALLTDSDAGVLLLTNHKESRLICLNPDGKKNEVRITQSGSLVPFNTGITPSRDGKSVYVYSSSIEMGDESQYATGLLVSTLDLATMRMNKPLQYPFSAEKIQFLYDQGGGVKRKKEIHAMNFNPDLLEMDNGSLVILTCPQDVTTSFNTTAPNANGQSSTIASTTYYAGPILAFYLNPAGKTFDLVSIPRSMTMTRGAMSGSGSIQIVQSPGITRTYGAFSAARRGDRIIIIYNEVEKNINRDGNKKPAAAYKPDDLVLAEALISADKKLEYRKQIGEELDHNYAYFLGSMAPTTSDALVFPIAKEGSNFRSFKTLYSNWCFLTIP